MKIYTNTSPSRIYLEALRDIWLEGETLVARGKRIKELRPVCIENPLAIPFIYVPKRHNNPFFSIFESSFWIPAGRSDVETLSYFNSNMKQFSDDGKTFNAPYGERLRFWGRNSSRGIFPEKELDQFKDCYEKLMKDPNTRQAIMVISNPSFDGNEYTSSGGRDIACNTVISFKLRNNKLDITVFNRSNDLIYGALGANITQFVTIQRLMAGFLGVEVGCYYQITDSLHIYTEDFGSKILEETINFALEKLPLPEYYIPNSPVPDLYLEDTDELYKEFFDNHLSKIINREFSYDDLPESEYWANCYLALMAYAYHKNGEFTKVIESLGRMSRSYEKMACAVWLMETKKYETSDMEQIFYGDNYDKEMMQLCQIVFNKG